MWSKTWRLKRKKLVRENEETYIQGRKENATGYTRRWKGSGFCGALLGELMIVLSQDAYPCIWSQAWRNSTQKGLFSLWTYSLAHGLFTLNIYGESFTCRRMCPYVFSNNDDGLERWWQMWDVWCRGEECWGQARGEGTEISTEVIGRNLIWDYEYVHHDLKWHSQVCNQNGTFALNIFFLCAWCYRMLTKKKREMLFPILSWTLRQSVWPGPFKISFYICCPWLLYVDIL